MCSKHDMDAYMATLFDGEARDLCWELGQSKARPNYQHKSREYSCIK